MRCVFCNNQDDNHLFGCPGGSKLSNKMASPDCCTGSLFHTPECRFWSTPGAVVNMKPAAVVLLSDEEALEVLIQCMRTSAQDTLAALLKRGYTIAAKPKANT